GKRKLPAAGPEVGRVLARLARPEYVGKVPAQGKHVKRVPCIMVECQADLFLKETQVYTEIQSIDPFPGIVGRYQSGRGNSQVTFAPYKIVALVGRHRGDISVVIYALVTQGTVRNPEFQVADEIPGALHEALLVDTPGSRSGREKAEPLI